MADTHANMVATKSSSCTFCQELSGRPSYFSRLYAESLESRVVYDDGLFVVFPAIGQIFHGWLLIAPKSHIETMAALAPSDLRKLENLIKKLRATLPQDFTICFEHGAKESTGASCGIYHAHMHLVPLPGALPRHEIHPGLRRVSASFQATLSTLKAAQEYFVLFDSSGETFAHEIKTPEISPPSQHLRRELVRHFGLDIPWDWRAYGREQSLIAVMRAFINDSVSSLTTSKVVLP